jgi:hypothetical protein
VERHERSKSVRRSRATSDDHSRRRHHHAALTPEPSKGEKRKEHMPHDLQLPVTMGERGNVEASRRPYGINGEDPAIRTAHRIVNDPLELAHVRRRRPLPRAPEPGRPARQPDDHRRTRSPPLRLRSTNRTHHDPAPARRNPCTTSTRPTMWFTRPLIQGRSVRGKRPAQLV